MPINFVKPSANRYGLAIIIALIIHLFILLVLTISLRSASLTTPEPSTNQIQASLMSTPVVAAAPPPPPPAAKPVTIKATVNPETINAAEAPDGTLALTIKEKPVQKPKPLPKKPDKPEKPLKTPQPLTKLKQLSLEQALQQEAQQQPSDHPPRKLLEHSLASEISAEANQAKSTSTTATKAKAAANAGEVDRYKSLILQQIQQNWIVPQNVEHLSCELRVEVAPGGMVLKVTVTHSSGNEALDRSALAAVNKASPLPVPKNSADFDAFRSFTITVKPEGVEM